MTPRLLPRGLWERAAAWVWHSVKSAVDERAAAVHQLRLRKVARMRKIAKSATASVEAAALDDVRHRRRPGVDISQYLLQYTIPSR